MFLFRSARFARAINTTKSKFSGITNASNATTRSFKTAGLVGAGTITATALLFNSTFADEVKKDYEAVRKSIAEMLDSRPDYDDGSLGPVFLRLAWHASGTFSKEDTTGGCTGARMRFEPESSDPANAGLEVARKELEAVKAEFPWISYSDLWSLASIVAIEEMGGPSVPWRPGRTDEDSGKHSHVNPGRLPDAAQGAAHVRDVFYRMGFNDQEIVALVGAHAVGRCHKDRSGFEGPWTASPTMFTNDFFIQLLDRKWKEKKWDGPRQFEDENKELMMLPTDIALIQDEKFRKWVEIYAKDEDKFFEDFSAAFSKLQELGVNYPKKASWFSSLFNWGIGNK